MSLVLDALRRVEKPDAKAGSVGVAVPSYRPLRRRRRSLLPLLLGLGMGVILMLLLGFRDRDAIDNAPASAVDSRPVLASLRTSGAGGAALPPVLVNPTPLSAVTAAAPPPPRPEFPRSRPGVSAYSGPPRGLAPISPTRPPAVAPVVTSALVLQAISIRDSYPIAMVSDQLVKEGDLLGRTRVMRIGSDSIEVLLESGKREIIRFPQPPPSRPDSSPLPDPDRS